MVRETFIVILHIIVVSAFLIYHAISLRTKFLNIMWCIKSVFHITQRCMKTNKYINIYEWLFLVGYYPDELIFTMSCGTNIINNHSSPK